MPDEPKRKTDVIIHPAFRERFEAGWKIERGRPACGGHWVWMKPRGQKFILHGCICHETPEHH